MNEEEKTRRILKARRQTIFLKDGSVMAPTSETKRTICNVHLFLAREIGELKVQEKTKRRLLVLVDEAYNMGKRMHNKLDIYKSEVTEHVEN